MYRYLSLVLATFGVAMACGGGVISAIAEDRLPAPLGNIAYDPKPLEWNGKLSIIDVKFDEEIGEDEQVPGIKWTLKANQDLRLSQLHDALQSRAGRLAFYKTLKGATIEVYATRLWMSRKLEFGFLSDDVLEKGMAIEVWIHVNDDRVRQLVASGATNMTFKRR